MDEDECPLLSSGAVKGVRFSLKQSTAQFKAVESYPEHSIEYFFFVISHISPLFSILSTQSAALLYINRRCLVIIHLSAHLNAFRSVLLLSSLSVVSYTCQIQGRAILYLFTPALNKLKSKVNCLSIRLVRLCIGPPPSSSPSRPRLFFFIPKTVISPPSFLLRRSAGSSRL